MSFTSKKKAVASPYSKILSFNGQSGEIKLYDAESQETTILKKFTGVIVDDELLQVDGYDPESEGGIWSPVVRDTKHIRVIVTKEGDLAEGSWREIKDKVENRNGKLHKLIAVWHPELGRCLVKFKGSAFYAYSNAVKQLKKDGLTVDDVNLFTIEKGKAQKKGGTNFVIPKFTFEEFPYDLDGNEYVACAAYCKEIDEYVKVNEVNADAHVTDTTEDEDYAPQEMEEEDFLADIE